MPTIMPRILPEDIPPKFVLDCQKCQLSKQRSRIIWGEGNVFAPLFVILDNPGARENRQGEPYLCGARETLQLAAIKAGIGLDRLYISYILKCRPVRAYDKPEAREKCLGYLWEQLDIIKPKVLMILGNVAVKAFLNEPLAEVKNLRGKIHHWFNYDAVVSYHPLAVRRRPNLGRQFAEDWQLTASLLNSKQRGSS